MALPVKPDCGTTKTTGKQVAVDVNWSVCGNVADPRQLEFVPLGGMRGKNLDLSQETEDVTDDRTVGDYTETIGTTKNFTFSADGIANYTDGNLNNLNAVEAMYRQPGPLYLHVRITEPALTTYAYCLVTNFSKSFPHDSAVTFDLEMVATTSDYGVLTVETKPFDPVTGVTVTPGTMTLEVGESALLTAAVQPATAQQGVTFESDDTGVATVDGAGRVTAVASGTAEITVTSVADDQKTATMTVTVN